jgi:hypothetical protein
MRVPQRRNHLDRLRDIRQIQDAQPSGMPVCANGLDEGGLPITGFIFERVSCTPHPRNRCIWSRTPCWLFRSTP